MTSLTWPSSSLIKRSRSTWAMGSYSTADTVVKQTFDCVMNIPQWLVLDIAHRVMCYRYCRQICPKQMSSQNLFLRHATHIIVNVHWLMSSTVNNACFCVTYCLSCLVVLLQCIWASLPEINKMMTMTTRSARSSWLHVLHCGPWHVAHTSAATLVLSKVQRCRSPVRLQYYRAAL